MEEFLDSCLSEEPLIPKPGNSTFPLHPRLRQFEHHQDNFHHLKFLASGSKGFVFTFKLRGKDLCLKLVTLLDPDY